MDDFIKANKDMWDDRVDVHKKSKFYDVEGFLKGKQTLDPVELDEVGDVSDKSLLHLMCHFGIDTLSWSRLGARTTGVDFSEKAVKLAGDLSKQIGVDAKFIASDIYKLPEVLDDEFDIVFTSGGVLTWLPDLNEWAQIVAKYVKRGGFFYIREFHPFPYIFDDDEGVEDFRLRYPYFTPVEPLEFEANSSYAEPDTKLKAKVMYEWNHSISTLLNSLIDAGLRIDFFNEFPFTTWKALPFLQEREDGRWVLPSHQESMPLMYSLRATKP
ncbi:MAG: class I SAM-dependent methyltransferase [Candidatus Thorarchaeota archaeon]|jgi:SAM-dependent methyltransferase